MTFQNLDELMAFFDRFAADKMREFEFGMLLRDSLGLFDDIADDIDDVIAGAREWHEEAMGEWRIEARRQLAAMPLRFPLTVTFEDAKRTMKVTEGL